MKEEGKKVILKGIGASSGQAKGKVKVIHQPEDASKVEKGEILVAPFTSPLLTLAILNASALITDEGGLMSHGAIIAREMGIPAVVGTKRATSILKDGQETTVNGNRGEVYEK